MQVIAVTKNIAHQLISDCTTAVGRAHISCYASAQQLLCGWRNRFFRLILLIFLATSKGYSEDYIRLNDATTIILTRHSDSTYKIASNEFLLVRRIAKTEQFTSF